MSECSPRAREVSDFLAVLCPWSDNPTEDLGGSVDLLAWKSSLLDCIAEDSDDPEARVVAAQVRATLASARSSALVARAHDEAKRYQSSGSGW